MDLRLKQVFYLQAILSSLIGLLKNHVWPGNIRQLRNVAEQISVLEKSRSITAAVLKDYLPQSTQQLPAIINKKKSEGDFSSEREILYKVLFDMKSDLNDLKKLTLELMNNENHSEVQKNNEHLIEKIYKKDAQEAPASQNELLALSPAHKPQNTIEVFENDTVSKYVEVEELEDDLIEETLSLHQKELELIKKSLERHKGKRKLAADELGISERTLYRKIKQYDL